MLWLLSHYYADGILVLIVLWLVCGATYAWNPWRLVEGFDRSTSTSKAQFFFWTIAGLFGYTAFFLAWMHQKLILPPGVVPSFPAMAPWLISAVGLSGTTAVAAKGITSGYVSTGRIKKTSTDQPKGGLLLDDTGFPELVKIQLMAWTAIAIGVFLSKLALQIHQGDFSTFPDVDGTLLALLGIGQGSYVGKKLASIDPPAAAPAAQPVAPMPN